MKKLFLFLVLLSGCHDPEACKSFPSAPDVKEVTRARGCRLYRVTWHEAVGYGCQEHSAIITKCRNTTINYEAETW